jgi:hypothetical protein
MSIIKQLEDKFLNRDVKFISGNFKGLTGKCINVEEKEDALYGTLLTFQLSNGDIGYAEKSEHFEFIND